MAKNGVKPPPRGCWADGCPIHDPDNFHGRAPAPGWAYKCKWESDNLMYAMQHGMTPVKRRKSWLRRMLESLGT